MNKQKEIRSTGNPDFSDSLTKEIIEYMARKGREAKLQGKGMRDKKNCYTCRHCGKYRGTCYNKMCIRDSFFSGGEFERSELDAETI